MFSLAIILFLYLFLIILFLFFVFLMVYEIFPTALFFGGPYVVTRSEYVSKMISLSNPKKEDRVLDLGAGDGRIVIAYANTGVIAYGYEINPYLVKIAKTKIKNSGFDKTAFVDCKNFWREDLSGFDIVAIYPAGFMMEKLEDKLEKELHSGAKVVVNGFKFPNWKVKNSDGQIYLYEKQ